MGCLPSTGDEEGCHQAPHEVGLSLSVVASSEFGRRALDPFWQIPTYEHFAPESAVKVGTFLLGFGARVSSLVLVC